MTKQPESVSAPKPIRTVRDDVWTNNPHPRTSHDVRLRDVMVTHAKSTR
jgi:hypothetical protein